MRNGAMVWCVLAIGCGGGSSPGRGGLGEVCYPNETCNAGFTCVNGTCAVPMDAGVDAPPDAPEAVQSLTTDLDLLFVIDNSPGMVDKQTVFAANFPKIVQGLDSFPTGRPSLHIAVATSTVDIGVQGFGPGCPSPAPNDNGLFQNIPRITGCSPPTGRFISDIMNSTGGRTTNYSGTLDAAFSCIAQVGETGCGFEAPLEAIKRALDGSRPENAGFLRPSALLGVIVFTDEDDCSVADTSIFGLDPAAAGPGDFRCQPLYAYQCDQPISATAPGSYTGCKTLQGSYLKDPAAYYQFLSTLKPAGEIAIALVMGDAASSISTGAITTPFNQTLALLPSCTTVINGNPNIGRPGIRLSHFLASAQADHAQSSTVCTADYSAAQQSIASMLLAAMRPCMQGNIDTRDTDPANPGVQLACSVRDQVTSGAIASPLPACQMADPTTVATTAALPCWYASVDLSACASTTTHYSINVDRAAPAPDGTTTLVSCKYAP